MRLSTEADRDDSRGLDVLHAAFDAGITFLDTADAYCHTDGDVGHNERLIAHALATWDGDRSRIRVATKGGLTRPGGLWIPDGRARHLRAACEASRLALGVERIWLYQLHAVDPRVPLSTSVRALAALARDGLVERIGLCNVTVQQIEEARRLVDIAAVQVEVNPWNDDAFLGGVAHYCAAHDIRLVAHRPLGGPKRAGRAAKDPLLTALAADHRSTPQEMVLAWLADLSPAIIPVPGATRVETARSIARTAAIRLTDVDRERLDERFRSAAALRSSAGLTPAPASAARNGEVVLIMGLPGAGKTTMAQTFVARGYDRLNRDEAGGSLRELVEEFNRLLESGSSRIVLDNTFVSRKSRARVVQAAARAGLAVRCVWLKTSVEDAQVNAVWRMWSTYQRLLGPDEMREAVKRDVNAFGPTVQFRYQRDLEPPDPSEGFACVDVVPFARERRPPFSQKAVLVWCDGILVRSRSGLRSPSSPEDVELVEDRSQVLRRHAEAGWRVLGLSWRPDVAAGTITAEMVDTVFAKVRELLDVAIDIRYCPHGGGAPACWCRKPLPGLGVAFVREYELDPAECTYVGAGAHDAAFARRLGFTYRDAADFFSA